MTFSSLRECAIMVVEDEYLLAEDICTELVNSHALVVGPAATVQQGLALLHDSDRIDGAILDVNLRGEPVFSLADELAERDVPFVFATGYDASAIPDRFQGVIRCEKPLQMSRVVEAIGRVIQT
jgi:DNA-binding response OmpR family regulator